MPGAIKILRHFITLLQGCFAGVLFGQMVHLLSVKQPFSFLLFFLIAGGTALLLLFQLFKCSVLRYVLNTSSFVWIYFASPILYGAILLLHLLPVIYNFEESHLIINFYLVGSLIALALVVAENNLLNINLLQKVFAGFSTAKRVNARMANLLWSMTLVVFAFFTFLIYQSGGTGIFQVIASTLLFSSVLFVLLTGVKIVMLKRVRRLPSNNEEKCIKDKNHGVQSQGIWWQLTGENLLKDILNAGEEERPLLYGKIRQIPLLEKREILEDIFLNHLPHDKELEYTIHFLQKLHGNLADSETSYDIDSVSSIPAIKRFIRLSIEEENPMLVQKLLNDNRPEVKKAAILATVHFNEASFIPTLVNFLKDPVFAFAAKEALYGFGDKCLPFLRSGKYRNKDNTFFIEHCLDLVASYKSEDAKDFLLEMLNEPQKRFRFLAARALLKNGYTLSGLQKTQFLHFIESLIGIIAIEREIRCTLEASDAQLVEALLEEEKEKTTLVFDLLEAFVFMPVLNVLRSIHADEPENDSFVAFALIDLFFPLILRNKCKILLGSRRNEIISERLQVEYLNEQIWFNFSGREEAIKQILKMDYGQIGYWLRACALKQLTTIPGQQISLLIQAEVFNENKLIQEVACEVLHALNYDFYFLQMKRLPPERAKILKYKIETNKYPERNIAIEESQLLFTQTQFLKTIPFFKEYTYESLARKTMLFLPHSLGREKRKISFDPYSTSGYWIVCQGKFRLCQWGKELLNARKDNIIDMSFLVEAEEDSIILEPSGEIIIYFIEYYSFNKLYLRSGLLKKAIIQPKLEQSAELPIA